MNAPRTTLAFLLAGGLLAPACILDFERFEGEAVPTTVSIGGGGSGAGTTTTTSSMGGEGGAGGMVPVECTNMVQDGNETDVDCGGDECPACTNDLTCNVFSDCASLFCAAGTCAPCSDSPECAPAGDAFCSNGICIQRKDPGEPCSGAAECKSAQCVDDVCCATACDGTCEACNEGLTGTASGTCAPVFGATDPDDECNGTDVCNAGACASLCGLSPTPPGGTCPAACTGGCAGTTCTIDCNADSACANSVINCPPGFDCAVSCNGSSGCRTATIHCPEGFACDVGCTGMMSCRDAVVQCSATGICDVSCGGANQTCRDATVNCGDNECRATCAGSTPTVACGSSCMCTPC